MENSPISPEAEFIRYRDRLKRLVIARFPAELVCQAVERIVWHCSSAEDPSLLLLAMQAGNFLRFTGHPDADLYQEMTLALAKQILVDNPLQPVALRILLEVNDAGVDATGTAEDFFEDFL